MCAVPDAFVLGQRSPPLAQSMGDPLLIRNVLLVVGVYLAEVADQPSLLMGR